MIITDLLLAKKHANHPKLEAMLVEANEKGYIAKELDLLFYLVPLHFANTSYPQNRILEELNRATKLGHDMLKVLSAAELNRPYSSEIMHHIEEFFQILPHPNPEMRISQRTDWLANHTDYRPSIYKPGQLELRREVFLATALAFLGRQVLTKMIANAERVAAQEGNIVAILQVLVHSKEILNVSFYNKSSTLYLINNSCST